MNNDEKRFPEYLTQLRVLMLNPPFLPRFSRAQRSPAVTKSGTLYYPIWLAYATGVLEDAGCQVRLIDAPAEGIPLEQLQHLVESWRPHMLVTDTSTPSFYNDMQVVQELKGRRPAMFCVAAGPHVSALPDEALRQAPALDAVARHEYEYTLLELARAFIAGGPLEQVAGLSFRRQDAIVHNPDRPFIEDLDALPFVARVYKTHLNPLHYFYAITPYPQVAIVTGRGCPHRCVYCVYPQAFQGRRYRYRSPSNVVAEFEYIARELPQVRHVFVEDDTLTVNRERCRELAERLRQARTGLTFTANSRADVDFETLKALKAAGCRMLCVGFESGDDEVLRQIRKGLTTDQMKRFMRDARRAGILVHGCFMAGCPGETPQSLQRTLQLAKELNPDTAQFFPLMVYPGTEAYAWAEHSGYLRTRDFRQWVTDEGLHNCVVDLPGLPAEALVAWCDEARRQFYLRPRYIFSKLTQVTSHPDEFVRVVKAARAFLPFLFRRHHQNAGGC
ncbi:MAG: B12-binding domain-containing radical SAM protein [Anaerolineae bacterium]